MSGLSTSSIKSSIQAGIELQKGSLKDNELRQTVYVFGKSNKKELSKYVKEHTHDWQWQEMSKEGFVEAFYCQTDRGSLNYIPLFNSKAKNYTPQQLKPTAFGVARDLVGKACGQLKSKKPVELVFVSCSKEQIKGALVGFGLSRYRYKVKLQEKLKLYLSFVGEKLSAKELEGIFRKYESVNLARHLVNLPADILDPVGYVKLVKSLFKGAKVKVWDPTQLEKNKFGLITAVGRSAHSGPYMVHIQHRGAAKSKKPIAFVGKGITFDTGGLDLKAAAYMRHMKKDMGGSASVVGLAYYMLETQAKVNCDFYLAIAENAITRDSFRPGDVFTAKNGLEIEIHNTDAEGRLVLADVMYHAVTQKEKPQAVIDIATLTGAIKYGLGAYLPGVFSSDQKLEKKLLSSAKKCGEPLWPMPLDVQQEKALKSSVADFANCGDGMGGGISAALFLEKFTEGLPWAHFDIYSWSEGSRGALVENGGSGQLVQTLIDYLGA